MTAARPHVVVMAAGEGTRLRPITERWPKPVLPIDGRPVVGTLLRALAADGFSSATVVTGHLGERVESLLGDGAAFDISIRYVRQPQRDGSADVVRRALDAGVKPPLLVVAADTVFAARTFELFAREWDGAAGAIAARRGQPAGGGKPGLDPRLARASAGAAKLTSVPLWGIGAELLPCLEDLPGPPFELADAVGRALDAGLDVRTVVVPGTRDLTYPVDLIRENFPYLSP